MGCDKALKKSYVPPYRMFFLIIKYQIDEWRSDNLPWGGDTAARRQGRRIEQTRPVQEEVGNSFLFWLAVTKQPQNYMFIYFFNASLVSSRLAEFGRRLHRKPTYCLTCSNPRAMQRFGFFQRMFWGGRFKAFLLRQVSHGGSQQWRQSGEDRKISKSTDFRSSFVLFFFV